MAFDKIMFNSAGAPDGDDLPGKLGILTPVCTGANRRAAPDRRRRTWWSLVYGGFRPRRRSHRRLSDYSSEPTDWLESELLYLTMGILMLCTADAVLTLNLLAMGAQEANFFMAHLIERGDYLFGAAKMALTGLGLVLLVMYARFRLFKLVSVHALLRLFFFAYFGLIGYEIFLFRII